VYAVVNSVVKCLIEGSYVCAVVNSAVKWLIEGSCVCCCEQCSELVN